VLILEWDVDKARDNEQKHGVSFLEASEVFDDDHSSSVPDRTIPPLSSVTLSSAFLNRAGIWLCPILSAKTAFG
jgi:hypothetical protein